MTTDTASRTREELTVQEMARRSGLSEHTLRYYERIGLLTPIPRDRSSGHRRYSEDSVGLVESLACLRGTGMSIDDMRTFLRLRERGTDAAAEQKALFAAHKAVVERELELTKIRLEYLAGKVAYWEAVEAGDAEAVHVIGASNHLIVKSLGKEQR